jgi:hypothetical protein
MRGALAVVNAWLPFLVAIVPAAAAVAAAVVAARSATRARAAEFQAARIRDLENRVAAYKADVYGPMLEFFRETFDSTISGGPSQSATEAVGTFSKFATWIQIYGSDEAVRATHKFMQAAYTTPPPEVLMRYYTELVLAARRDLNDSATTVDLVDLIGIRMKDVHAHRIGHLLLVDERELWRQTTWTPPWGNRYDEE